MKLRISVPYQRRFAAALSVFFIALIGASPTNGRQWERLPKKENPYTSLYEGSGFEKEIERAFPFKEVDYGGERSLQEGESEFQPIRIKFDTRLLDERRSESESKSKAIDHIVDEILPAAAAKWSQHLAVRPVQGTINLKPDDCGTDFGWSQRLVETNYSNADLVIVVAGDDFECNERTLAFAFFCALDSTTNRPILGAMNFCVTNSEGRSASLPVIGGIELSEFYSYWTGATFRPEHVQLDLLKTTIHELAHVLGFISFLYTFFRDENGNPLTERDSKGFPLLQTRQCLNGTTVRGFYPSEQTVQVKQLPDGRYEHYLITSRVKTIAQNHFGCDTLPGGRLDEFDGDCVGSHWHERHWYNELMSPVITLTSTNALSYLTLALMEDSGFYQVDYRGASPSSFGLNAGCDFVDDNCINDGGSMPSWGRGNFCNSSLVLSNNGVASESLNNVFCDPSHNYWTVCDLSEFIKPESWQISYFTNPPLYSSFAFADSCPILGIGLGLDCRRTDTYNMFYTGESVGPDSRCVDAYYQNDVGRANQPACMKVTCDADSGVVRLGESGSEYSCSFDFQEIPLSGGRPGSTLICPRLSVVCPELFTCPDGCFGRGKCVVSNPSNETIGSANPTCECFDDTLDSNSCMPPGLGEPRSDTPSGDVIIHPGDIQFGTSPPTSDGSSGWGASDRLLALHFFVAVIPWIVYLLLNELSE